MKKFNLTDRVLRTTGSDWDGDVPMLGETMAEYLISQLPEFEELINELLVNEIQGLENLPMNFLSMS